MSSPAEAAEAVLVAFSDLHLREGEDRARREQRLVRAVDAAMAMASAPCAVLLSGDLADEPSSTAYERARELLSPLGAPIHAIPGNHDDRDMLRERFGPAGGAPGEQVRFAVSCGGLRLVGLDSSVPGREGGALGERQLAWLERTLAAEPESPTLLALHHPPLASGLSRMDAIALDGVDAIALERLLAGHPQVQSVTCGHVHTAMATSFAGRSLTICPSTNSAACLDLREDVELEFSSARPGLGFAVHALVGGRLVSHLQSLAPDAP